MSILNRIKSRQKELLILLIFLQALLPFFWTVPLDFGDSAQVYSAHNELYRRGFVWQNINFGSISDKGVSFLFVYNLPFYLLHKIGFSLNVIQKFLYSFWLFIAGFSAFMLVRYILKKGRFSEIAAFLAANFYMFNIFSLKYFWQRGVMLYVYGFLPLIVLCSIKFFKDSDKKNLPILALLAFLVSPAGGNPTYLFTIVLVVLYYFLMDFFLGPDYKSFVRKFLNLLLVMMFILLAWAFIIAPVMPLIGTEAKNILSLPQANLADIGKVNSFSDFTQGVRFLGHWGFWAQYKGSLYNPYSPVYKTALFIFLGFLIVLLAYSSLLSKKYKRQVIIFGFLTVASFILINGPNPPFGFIYIFLYNHIPYFFVFKNPLDKIGMPFILGFVCLLGVAIKTVMEKLDKIKFKKVSICSAAFAIMVIVAFDLYSFPFFNGQLFPDYKDGVLQSNKTEIPDYYKQASDYLNKKKMISRTFVLPIQHEDNTPFIWHYAGVDPLTQYLDNGFFQVSGKYATLPIEKMLMSFKDKVNFSGLVANVSWPFNIRYLLLENDVDWKFYDDSISPNEIKQGLDMQQDVLIDKSYGELNIYKISDHYFLPLFYTSNHPMIFTESPFALSGLFKKNYDNRLALYLTEQNGDRLNNFFGKAGEYETYIIELPSLWMDNSSFEDGLWQKAPADCTVAMNGEPNFTMKLSDDATEGQYSLELGSKNHFACTAKNFTVNLKPDHLYKYSFDYKNVKGGRVDYYYRLDGEKSYDFDGSIEAENHNWNHFETIIDVPAEISRINFHFYASSKDNQEVINRFDNIKLTPIELEFQKKSDKKEIKTPVLEFKRINPTKYRIRVHQAKDSFPLIFSESFHKEWKAYIVNKVKNYKVESNLLNDYNIFDGNENDQATKEELKKYVENGWVSVLGNDFISKNFQDTIQNNNLSKGHIWDTWFKYEIDKEDHLTANGYANGWWVDIDKIKESGQYIQNRDGSVDFEMIIEFWPQQLFYLGLGISAVALLFCLVFLIYLYRKFRGRSTGKLLDTILPK